MIESPQIYKGIKLKYKEGLWIYKVHGVSWWNLNLRDAKSRIDVLLKLEGVK